MFGFYCSRILGMSKTTITSLFSTIRFISTANFNNNINNQSFVVSYLINSFGFTSKTAESISRRLYFYTRDKPDSVLMFFIDQGFTISHISKIVKIRPQVLLADPKSSLLPKLEFLRSIGASNSDLLIIVSRNPELLNRSLERFLNPCYDILRSALVSDNEKVIKTLKRLSPLTLSNLLTDFTVNISLLREIKVPQAAISMLVASYPTAMCQNVDKFAEGVKKVLEVGFDPSKASYVIGLAVFLQMSGKTWQHKKEVFRRWGFSEDEFWSIFRKLPKCMALSEKNVMFTMDFLVHKMGLGPADVVRAPSVLTYSLDTRIIPRCSVIKLLLLKGLITEDVPLCSVVKCTEKYFLERFVIKYEEEIPQLLDLVQRKVTLRELGFGFEDKSVGLGHAAHQS